MHDPDPHPDPGPDLHAGRPARIPAPDFARRGRAWIRKAAARTRLRFVGRRLTAGERAMIDWMFGPIDRLHRARVIARNFWWPVPNRRAMAPNGNIYFPGADYREDFSAPDVPIDLEALFMHEATHLYQHYQLGIWLMVRAPFDRDYDYSIRPGRTFQEYGIEQMGQMVQDFHLLRHGRRRLDNRHTIADYAGLLPLRP